MCKGNNQLSDQKLNRGSGVTPRCNVARLIVLRSYQRWLRWLREKTIVTMGASSREQQQTVSCVRAEGENPSSPTEPAPILLNGIMLRICPFQRDRHGQLDADYACIEVDEIASVGVLPQLKPDYALLRPIFPGIQLDRFGRSR